MLAADIAFTRHRDAEVKAELQIIEREVLRATQALEEVEQELVLLSGLRTTGQQYVDERLDAIELFLVRVDSDYGENKAKRFLVNEAKIKELIQKLKKYDE